MFHDKKVLALITARGGSKGLLKKNILDVNEQPLIFWTIDAAKKSRYIDRLIVSTDSEDIKNVCQALGAEVPFLRPRALASDTATSIDVVLHAVAFLENQGSRFDYLILLEPTSPLRTVDDIDGALSMLAHHAEAQAIVGVAKHESTHPNFSVRINEQGLLSPLTQGDNQSSRRQDISCVYYFEGTIYISKIEALKQKRSFYHNLTLPYIVDRHKALEVDELMDVYLVEAMMRYHKEHPNG